MFDDIHLPALIAMAPQKLWAGHVHCPDDDDCQILDVINVLATHLLVQHRQDGAVASSWFARVLVRLQESNLTKVMLC